MKYLSEKTLKKKYEFYKINDKENDLLHKYMNCFSNFYGAIDVKDMWEILKIYDVKITKEKFFNFIDIVQREKQNYGIYNLCEVYSEETSDKTKDKILINNELVGYGSGKFWTYYILEDKRDDTESICVLSKDEFLCHQIDRFWTASEYSIAMVDFVSNLVTSGFARNPMTGFPRGAILDLQGEPVIGKKLSEFCFYDHFEQFLFKRETRPNYIEKFKEEHNVSAARRVLKNIKDHIMVGRRVEFTQDFKYVLDDITDDCGVILSEEELERFTSLYMNLNNHSALWNRFGWTPYRLFEKGPKGPITLKLGSGIKKLFDDGEFDYKEFEEFCREHDIDIDNGDSKKYS